jgi:hypothetical protein
MVNYVLFSVTKTIFFLFRKKKRLPNKQIFVEVVRLQVADVFMPGKKKRCIGKKVTVGSTRYNYSDCFTGVQG